VSPVIASTLLYAIRQLISLLVHFAIAVCDCGLYTGQGTNLTVQVRMPSQNSEIVFPTTFFSYDAPTISSVTSLNERSTKGGVLTTIVGANFGTGPNGGNPGIVTIGGAQCTVSGAGTSYGHEQIVCRSPAGQGRNNTVTFTLLSRSVNASVGYDYAVPTILNVQPGVGSTAGGDVILSTCSGDTFVYPFASFGWVVFVI